MRVKYISHDNKEFPNEASCRAYELLIEAGKDSEFRKLVKGLFQGNISYVSRYSDDDTEEMFDLSRSMEGFIANLVVAIPALKLELERALSQQVDK